MQASTTRFTSDRFAGAHVVSLASGASRSARPLPSGTRFSAPGIARGFARLLADGADRLAQAALVWNPALRLRAIRAAIERDLARALDARLRVYESQRGQARDLIRAFRPDLLQCLRLPVEGFIGAAAEFRPTLHFCWGNDLTLYAHEHPAFGELTRDTLSTCAALLTDCRRDERLALAWGLRKGTPTLVVPGAGGIDTAAPEGAPERAVATESISFLTLRGLGGRYVDNLPVVRALPFLRNAIGDGFLLRMVGALRPYAPLLLAEAHRVGGERFLEFLDRIAHEQVPALIARHRFVFSATYHDGTPNSMLETMWHGGVPICSDLESIREWITEGDNGYLFDMRSPEGIAAVFARAVREQELHDAFRRRNRELIRERADYRTCMARVMELYEGLG